MREFDGLAAALEQAGVTVHTFEDTPEPHTPDSIFPNNWVSFHADGTVVLYPMLAENRRLERRLDLIEALSAKHGFHASRVIDLTRHEHTGRYLEGTGSLVLDRIHRVAYACISPRTDLDVLGDFAQQLDYDIVAFEAHDANGKAIYHTNVLMSVGERFAAVCLNAIREDERDGVLSQLRGTGPDRRGPVARTDERLCRQHAGAGLVAHRQRGCHVPAGARCLNCRAASDVGIDVRPDCRRAYPHHREAGRRQRPLHAGGAASAQEETTINDYNSGQMLELGVKILLAYLLGSLIGSLLVGQLRGGVDIRKLGSGNAGGTNALRTQGWSFALWVMIIDIGKGWLAAGLLAPMNLPGIGIDPAGRARLAGGGLRRRRSSSVTFIRSGTDSAAARVRRP